jgi:hypothetical protein
MPLPRPTQQSSVTLPKKDKSDFRPSDVFRFEPQADITISELAYLISIFWTLDVSYEKFFEFDKDLQRNFRPLKKSE